MSSDTRFILQPDETSSSEYKIFDVIKQSVEARGLDREEARETADRWNKEWQSQIKTYT